MNSKLSEQLVQGTTADPTDVPMLELRNVVVTFPTDRGSISPVDDVSLVIRKGETLGLVGESGCGKSTLGRAVLRLVPTVSGEVLLDGEDLKEKSAAEMRPLRKDLHGDLPGSARVTRSDHERLGDRQRTAQGPQAGQPVRHHGAD